MSLQRATGAVDEKFGCSPPRKLPSQRHMVQRTDKGRFSKLPAAQPRSQQVETNSRNRENNSQCQAVTGEEATSSFCTCALLHTSALMDTTGKASLSKEHNATNITTLEGIIQEQCSGHLLSPLPSICSHIFAANFPLGNPPSTHCPSWGWNYPHASGMQWA